MTIKTKPKMINVPIQDLEALKLRLSTGTPLADTDTTIILSILNVYQWMYVQLESAKLTLHRLTKMLGFSTEKKKEVCSRATSALQLSPFNPRYRFIRSLCSNSEGNLPRALLDCRAALRLSPAQDVYSQQYRKLLERTRE